MSESWGAVDDRRAPDWEQQVGESWECHPGAVSVLVLGTEDWILLYGIHRICPPILEEMPSEIEERQGRAHSSAPLCFAGAKMVLWWAQGHEMRLNNKENINSLLIFY